MGTRTIRRTWKVDGLYADVTTAKLSDPTGTYGVKRDDTDAVVVADGVNMTRVSQGIYEYEFTEPAAGLSYTAYVEFVYLGQTYRFEHSLAASADATGLAQGYTEFRRAVGRFLGYGRDPTGWTSDQIQDVEDILKSGLRRFHTPPPLPGEKYGHEWSFMKPATTLATVADDYQYDLPENFGMLHGPMTYAPGSSVLYPEIEIVGEHQIRIRQQDGTVTGRPSLAAIRPKTPDATVGTRWEILFWPTPDAVYTIHYRYMVDPTALDANNILPMGGIQHAETILEACLAAAEETLHDESALHGARFKELLLASVSRDRKVSAPMTLGANRDRSDVPDADWHDMDENIVRYNGVEY